MGSESSPGAPATQDDTEHSDLPPGAPLALGRAAAGEDVSGKDEFDVLEWVLGPTPTPEDDVTVVLDTPKGKRELVFHIVGVDGDEIAAAEREHQTGRVIFGVPELTSAGHAAVAALGITTMTNPAKGRTVEIRSEEFLRGVPDPGLALLGRFKKFPGILDGLSEMVRQISGYSASSVTRGRVSKVEAAAGNS